jgi:hypothetical protein
MELVPFRLFTLGKKILELRFLHSLERIFSCCLDVFSKDVLSSHLLVVDLAKVQVGKAGRVLWLVFPVVDLALGAKAFNLLAPVTNQALTSSPYMVSPQWRHIFIAIVRQTEEVPSYNLMYVIMRDACRGTFIMAPAECMLDAEKDHLRQVPKMQGQGRATSRLRDAGKGKVQVQPVLPQLWNGRALEPRHDYI